MFAYSVESHTPLQDAAFWSRDALSAVAPGILTPFSFSVLAEIMRRGWYNYYDKLGFEPYPGRRLLRQHNGRVYLNLSLSAQIEAERAGIEPLSFWLNGKAVPVAAWQKPGLLAALKTGRNQKRIATFLAELSGEFNNIDLRARAWYAKTQELRWTQAEILQVMEEIERIGADSAMVLFAVRHHLMLIYNRLFQLMQAHAVDATTWAQAVALLCHADSLHELEMAREIQAMGAMLRQVRAESPALDRWFESGQLTNWRDTLPESSLKAAISAFFDQYGRRCALEGELAHPRWQEAPEPVLEAIWACARLEPSTPKAETVDALAQSLQQRIEPNQQKQLLQWHQEAAALHKLQSRALSAFSYVQAGTRAWALAAANEAMSDGRLTSTDQVFSFELEEVKQMMTGEWNISSLDEIHATAAERTVQLQTWRQSTASPLLVGDVEAASTLQPPRAPDTAHIIDLDHTRLISGFSDLTHTDTLATPLFIRIDQLSAGDAILLPLAHGFLVDSEPALDPIWAAVQRYARQT